MSPVPDFTESVQWAVETTLRERWPDDNPTTRLADAEIKMFPTDRELTVCPAMFREHNKTGFVIIKIAEKTCRSQFYYRGFQQYGTGKSGCDDITGCVVTMHAGVCRQRSKRPGRVSVTTHRIQK
jgi:hypothetical protein